MNFRLKNSGVAMFVTLLSGGLYAQESVQTESDPYEEGMVLETIVVTASRREEELQDYVGSVTPITGREIERLGAVNMQDYLTHAPGVSYTESQPGLSNVTIRGVGSTVFQDQGQQTTGLFVNDIPMTEPVFNFATPDIDTFDVNRVEVLRGPQGTSFGSGTLGGAVNYIANTPVQGVTEGRVQVGASKTDRAEDMNTSIKGMLNAPLGENVALRVVGALNDDDGFIDNIRLNKKAINSSKSSGGRVMLDWLIGDNTKFSWMSLFNTIDLNSSPRDRSDLGDFLTELGQDEPFKTEIEIHSLKLTHEFEAMTLDVSATKKKKTQDTIIDLTVDPFIYGVVLGLPEIPQQPISFFQVADVPGNTFEMKLSSNGDSDINWLIGAFYDKTEVNASNIWNTPGAAGFIESRWAADFGAGIGARGAVNDNFFVIDIASEGTEKALFGEVKWQMTDALELVLGGRYYDTQVKTKQFNTGFFYQFTGSELDTRLQAEQNESGFSPKVALNYSFNDDHKVYALASRGFRYGGPNPNPSGSVSSAPSTYDSDSLINYEIGYRGTSSDGSYMLDIAAFQVDWSDMQFRLFTPEGLAYADNIGESRIRGLEAAFTWEPTSNFVWRTNVTLTDAELTEPFVRGPGQPAVPAGTTLPGAADTRISSAMTYRLDSEYSPFVTLAYRYQSDAPSDLFDQVRFNHGDFSVFDVRAGFEYLGAVVTVYVDNAGNEYGLTSEADSFLGPDKDFRTMMRPRTAGITIDYDF